RPRGGSTCRLRRLAPRRRRGDRGRAAVRRARPRAAWHRTPAARLRRGLCDRGAGAIAPSRRRGEQPAGSELLPTLGLRAGGARAVRTHPPKRRLRTSGASRWAVVSALMWNRLDERPLCGAKSRKLVEDAFAVEGAAEPGAAAPERVTVGS